MHTKARPPAYKIAAYHCHGAHKVLRMIHLGGEARRARARVQDEVHTHSAVEGESCGPAAQGAVAYLVRSLARSSIGSPHTGMQSYLPDVTPVRIPAAAVTIEDADALARMQERGQNITLRLRMECVNLPMEGSMNVIAE